MVAMVVGSTVIVRMAATAALDRVRVVRHTRTLVLSVAKATSAVLLTGVAVAVVVPGRQVLQRFPPVAQVVAGVPIRSRAPQLPTREVAVVVADQVETPVVRRRLAALVEAAVAGQVGRRRGMAACARLRMVRTAPMGSEAVAVVAHIATRAMPPRTDKERGALVARASSLCVMRFPSFPLPTLRLRRTTERRAPTT